MNPILDWLTPCLNADNLGVAGHGTYKCASMRAHFVYKVYIGVMWYRADLTLQSIERLLVERAALEAELAACKQQLQDRRTEEELRKRKSVGEVSAWQF